MDRLRILLLAPDANANGICASLIGYSQAQSLAQLHEVTIVILPSGEEDMRREQGAVRSVEVVQLPRLERLFHWAVRRLFKNDYMTHAQSLTALLRYPLSVAFEWQTWRQMRGRIAAGEFDIALRLLPVSAVLPSPLAYFLRNGPIPFVIGPISGGLPWPSGFGQVENHKQWISGLRGMYRFMPFARSTYRHATGIIAGTSQTYLEFAKYRDKLFFVLENGIDHSLCSRAQRNSERYDKLELIFIGSLTPIKGCDIALRAGATLLRSGLARFTVVGDGPERNRLEQLTRSLAIDQAVSFCGMVSHREAMQRLQSADVMVFPSIRDNNPAVVFEALATGAVPVVADFGGPADIVFPEVGYKVPLTDEEDMVSKIADILVHLAGNRDLLNRLREEGMAYARENLTWDAKVKSTTRILNWAVGRAPKPSLLPPKMMCLERGVIF